MIEAMRSRLHPPPGVSASLVGLPVLASSSGAKVADPWRRLLTLVAGLLAVALVLAVAFRGDRRRVLVPLVPVALASGWSALVLFAVRVPLNPMSVTLGVLVVALSTEFSVLLSERYRQERRGRARHRAGAAASLRAHRRRGRRLGGHGDRGLRRAGGFGNRDAAPVRLRHPDRPERIPAGRADRAAGSADGRLREPGAPASAPHRGGGGGCSRACAPAPAPEPQGPGHEPA